MGRRLLLALTLVLAACSEDEWTGPPPTTTLPSEGTVERWVVDNATTLTDLRSAIDGFGDGEVPLACSTLGVQARTAATNVEPIPDAELNGEWQAHLDRLDVSALDCPGDPPDPTDLVAADVWLGEVLALHDW